MIFSENPPDNFPLPIIFLIFVESIDPKPYYN